MQTTKIFSMLSASGPRCSLKNAMPKLMRSLTYDAALAQHWTPALIATVIHNYGSIGPWSDRRTFRVTPLAEATGVLMPRQDVDRYDSNDVDNGLLGYVWFDLSLNGGWSDLTAIINIVTDGSDIVLELDDIHVTISM